MVEKNSYTSKTGILFPLIALEQKIPYILEPKIASTSLGDDNVPLRSVKPYSFKRPKITVTFEELESYESEDEDDFEADYGQHERFQRKQSERQCNTIQKSNPSLSMVSIESTYEESF